MDEALARLKKEFTQFVVLKHPIPLKPFIIRCDASLLGISAVFSQLDGDDPERVISLCNRGLRRPEHDNIIGVVSYRMCCGEVSYICIRQLSNSVYGPPGSSISTNVWSSELERLAIAIDESDLQIIHVKGSINIEADFLSRRVNNTAGEVATYKDRDLVIATVQFSNSRNYAWFRRLIKEAQEEDEECKQIIVKSTL